MRAPKRPAKIMLRPQRRSGAAAQARAAELARLQAMTVEQRMREALGLNQEWDWLKPTTARRP